MSIHASPPGHLRPETKRWWRRIVAEYQLEQHHLKLLQLAAESWDRSNEARELLATQGLTFLDDRRNVRANPLILVEKDAKSLFMRALAALHLDVEPPVGC